MAKRLRGTPSISGRVNSIAVCFTWMVNNGLPHFSEIFVNIHVQVWISEEHKRQTAQRRRRISQRRRPMSQCTTTALVFFEGTNHIYTLAFNNRAYTHILSIAECTDILLSYGSRSVVQIVGINSCKLGFEHNICSLLEARAHILF